MSTDSQAQAPARPLAGGPAEVQAQVTSGSPDQRSHSSRERLQPSPKYCTCSVPTARPAPSRPPHTAPPPPASTPAWPVSSPAHLSSLALLPATLSSFVPATGNCWGPPSPPLLPTGPLPDPSPCHQDSARVPPPLWSVLSRASPFCFQHSCGCPWMHLPTPMLVGGSPS